MSLLGVLGPDRLAGVPSLCLVRRVFGACPSCGVTRAMAALLRGDLGPRHRRGLGALVLVTLGGVVAGDARRLCRCAKGSTRVQVSTVVDAPPATVWEDLRHIGSHPAWMQDAQAIRFTSGQREGVGTTFEADTKVGPFRLADPMEIIEWEEARSLAIRHGGVVTGTGRFTLEPAAGGRTRFTWQEELSFPWWMGGPLGSLVAGQVLRMVWRRNLTNLTRRFERR
ncbi:MAG: SRPBCC family protein [Actinomycetota bacterium]|nr:SRPBCC family protein [Actinomycetota bacterium]